MIITRFPSSLQRFFRPLRAGLSDDQFRHLWCLVVGLLVNLRAAKLSHLSAVTPAAGHRTRPGAFLAHGAWDAPALVERAAATLLAGMSPKTGEVVHLILDDNRIPKGARKMDWVSKVWDHKQQRFVRGHVARVAAVAFRGVVLPWRIDLWKPKGHAGGRYRKLTDMAAAMIKDFAAPAAGVKVRVLFDAFYLCPTVIKACTAKGFTFFSVAARNRNLTTANGKRRTIARLMPGLLRHQGRTVRAWPGRAGGTRRCGSRRSTATSAGPATCGWSSASGRAGRGRSASPSSPTNGGFGPGRSSRYTRRVGRSRCCSRNCTRIWGWAITKCCTGTRSCDTCTCAAWPTCC